MSKAQNTLSMDDTLLEREARYGDFADHASLSTALKDIMRSCSGFYGLHPHQAEALDMIVHKIARILNGDPDYIDNWHDIAGYATLVERELLKADPNSPKQIARKRTWATMLKALRRR